MKSNIDKDKLRRVGASLLVFAFLVMVSLLSCYLFFIDGLSWQDDIAFHLGQCYDIYYGFKNGFFGLSTNHIAMGAFGYNVYLFYGPLPHYLVAFLFYITEWMGTSLIGCYKFVVIVSVFVSGLFTYLLGLRVSKGNKGIALTGAALYMLFPYRFFCIFCRGAFNESVAMAFIPMLFYGLYRILNDDDLYISSFINTILAVVFLTLTHPFTALLSVSFALLYLLFNLKKLIRVLQRKRAVPYTLCSLILVVGLVFFYAIPTFIAKASSSYIVTDADMVWTTYEHVVSSISSSAHFSGFFDLTWISNNLQNSIFNGSFSATYLVISSLVGTGAMLLTLLADFFIQKLPYSKYYRFLVDLAVLIILPLCLYWRMEVIMAISIFYALFVLIMILKDRPNKEDNLASSSRIYRNPDTYYLLISTGLTLAFIFYGILWKGVPSIFYQAQFAWREWSMFNFFCTYLAIYGLSYLQGLRFKGKRYVTAILGCAAVLFMCFNQAYVEKRANYIETGSFHYSLVDEDYAKRIVHEGSSNEYLPIEFSDSSYVSKYSNSLYTPVRWALNSQTNFIHSLDSYNSETYCPRALEGKATVVATKLNTPSVTLKASVTSEDTLIQIPQFYYDGYVAKITDITSNSSSYVSAVKVDGLVAFNIEKAGSYTIDISYKGSASYQVGKYIFVVSLVGIVALGIDGYYFRKKKENDIIRRIIK